MRFHTEPVNVVILNSLCKSVRPWKERNSNYLLLFFLAFLFFFSFLFFFLYTLPCKSLRRRCTIKPRRFFSCSCVLMLRIQGQLSNNMGACVCLCVVDATSCSSERVFGCRLGRKEIEKRRERKNGKEKKKIFLWLAVCWHSILVGVWLKKQRRRRKKQKNKKRALAPRPPAHRSTDQLLDVEIE